MEPYQPQIDKAKEELAKVQKLASESLENYQPQIDAAKEKLKVAQEQAAEGLKATREKLGVALKQALENSQWVTEQVKTKGPTFFLAKSIDKTPFDEAVKDGCDIMTIFARAVRLPDPRLL
jgi:hypothetical protein